MGIWLNFYETGNEGCLCLGRIDFDVVNILYLDKDYQYNHIMLQSDGRLDALTVFNLLLGNRLGGIHE